MMNPRYLQRFGEPPPFGDPIARAALRYDPAAPYGDPELEGTEGKRLVEPPDVQPTMNKGSLVAAEDPYANYGSENGNDAGARQIMQPQAESSTKLNPLEPVNDPYLNYDSEVPIRATRRLFQPPPLPSMKRGSMVGDEDEPPMAPSAPLVIDTRELPTEAPPENPIRRYQRELDELKAPERGPVSKWAKLAAVALGAGQGYYNAANPNAKPIDASEAVQNLTLGRKYIDAMGEYQRKRKDIGERMKLAGDAEQVETNRTYRESLAANSRRADEDRDEAQRLRNFQFSISMARDGGKTLPADSPLTPGAIRMRNPLDKTGNTVVDIVPKNESRKITDQDIADALGMNVGDSVSDTLYQEGVKRVMEYRQALKLKQIEVEAKPDSTQTTDYKDFLLAKKEGYTGTYLSYKELDANLRRPQNNFTMPFPPPTPSADGGANPTVKAYATYRQPLPARPVNARNPNAIKAWDDMYAAVTKENPYYSFTGINTMKDFLGGGKTSQSLNAINTAAGHLSDLNDALRARDLGDVRLLNRVIEAYGRQTGNTTQATADTIIPLLAKEVARVYVAAGGTADERNEIQGSFNPTKGYAANKAALAATAKMFASKIKAVRNTFEVGAPGAKWEDHKFVSPEAQRVFDSFAPNAGPGRGGGGISVTAPDGSSHKFNTQAEADAFKKLAGVR